MARVVRLDRRPTRAAPPGRRRVALVAFPGFEVLDVTGPFEVFAAASELVRPAGYALEIVSSGARQLVSLSGVTLVPDRTIAGVRGGIDTLMVAGGRGVQRAMQDGALLAWLRRMARGVRRLASVCTGTFLLAEAGLLDGRRVTTHWRMCDELARRYPRLTVERDPIFVRQG